MVMSNTNTSNADMSNADMNNADMSNTNTSDTDLSAALRNPDQWYIVKQGDGHCDIVAGHQLAVSNPSEVNERQDQWGPFDSQGEAIARRVGLIRSGKCQPA